VEEAVTGPGSLRLEALRGSEKRRMWLVVFEDAHWRSLRPLTDLLPVPALRFGSGDLAQRWQHATGLPLLRVVARPGVMAAWRDAPVPDDTRPDGSDDVLAVNAAALPGPWLDHALGSAKPAVWTRDGRVVAAVARLAEVLPALERGEPTETALRGLGAERAAVEAPVIRFPWDLVEWNDAALAVDLTGGGDFEGSVHRYASLESPERIRVEAGARVDAYAVLDARHGPIRIEAGAEIMAHSLIVGPCHVGHGTQIFGGSVGHSSIGPVCRIAGEVDLCIWQGYANKRHHGFIGHSLIGEWANLGALTTTSDLKNNYGLVRVWIDGQERDTGQRKMGAVIGGHVRTGIGTLLPTGASVGVGANLFGGGRFAPKSVPTFAWWDGERTVEHRIDPFMETTRLAMARRDRPTSPADEALFRDLFLKTAGERESRAHAGSRPSS
jgi:UDP-N-acetylglucosamine diphosphorylase/glucosamine-1-phosphate N-acetyltransferase